MAGSSRSLFASTLSAQSKTPIIYIVENKEDATYFYDDLVNLQTPTPVCFFPSSFKREEVIDQENIIMRTDALNRLQQKIPVSIISYPEAVAEMVITSEALTSNSFLVKLGDKLSIEFINEVLYEYGFERVDFVVEPGQFAVRGSIIDIYSFAGEDPYRLDFFGDEIDSIRSFDIATQISKVKLEQITIIPNIQSGLKDEKRDNFFNFIPENSLLVVHNAEVVSDIVTQCDSEFSREDFFEALNRFTCIETGISGYFPTARSFQFNTSPQPAFNKNFKLLAENIEEKNKDGYQAFILSSNEKQIERLRAIFDDLDPGVKFAGMHFTLQNGFIDHDLKICCYTDHQIFERYHRFNVRNHGEEREQVTLKELNRLHPGDYVVHIDHGIGKFAGLVKIEQNGKIQEAVRLVYRDNDVLLVNIQSLHRISRFKGKDGIEPKINKLGSGAWQKLKDRTKSKVKDIARDLIALYAKRKEEQGFAFSPDSYLQNELEASFIYEDTPDQMKTTQAVKYDMERNIPMDRLICGDVGFGKTEVAIRAAFKAVADSKQVAVLVPTTILALQHFKTFSDRLKDFPANIEYISRLRPSAETKKAIKETAEGKVDILIGTHRLVSKDIKFKNLGLLVVDEEQKFGVSVKEKLKQLKVNVDTLTLTATPIPRTLQFSLMGARDLSIIQTPPPNRYPIITQLHSFNTEIIREAIRNEIGRGGQVFFIHNRVHNITEVETVVRREVPEARTVVAHGQMDGPKLEGIMLDFINGMYDVLISTTIIESGLDIPNANTIIINHAQNFGLSDLHQLRGRVGRSNKKAFCYLLAPPLSTLPEESRHRLEAIEEFSDLGSGFHIAMRDLDIRGAGNLLGAEQSGFIADIGFETYHRILNEAILELKHDEYHDLFSDETENSGNAFLKTSFVADCQIETDMELLFPDTYIQSISERMLLYRELDSIETEESLALFEASLVDRFGAIPSQAKELLEIVRLRWEAIRLGMERIVVKNKKMICYFVEQESYFQSPVFGKILEYIKQNPVKCRIKEKNNKLSMRFEPVDTVINAKLLLTEVSCMTFC